MNDFFVADSGLTGISNFYSFPSPSSFFSNSPLAEKVAAKFLGPL